MGSPAYRIRTENNVTIAEGLPRTAPAIQLHEGRVAVKGERHPKDLAPGASVKVFYPLDAAKGERKREILCTVSCYDADIAEEDRSPPEFASERPRGGRRVRASA